MSKAKKNLKLSKFGLRLLVALVVALAYPAFVLGYTWCHVATSELPGGRNGPLDAYRHTLASAVVAYTLDERAVDLVSWLMENSGKRSNLMDQQNNRIGTVIGSRARGFGEIEPAVAARVLSGRENASSPEQITWLPRERWQDGRLW